MTVTTKADLIAIVATRAEGSPEVAQHTHIECHCPGHVHRKENYEQGCFCPECASAQAVKLGLAASDTESEVDDPDDGPRWCEECGRLISMAITADGAVEEMEHWEASGPKDPSGEAYGGPPRSPEDWRVFMLCLVAIPDEHLSRVARIVMAPVPPVECQ